MYQGFHNHHIRATNHHSKMISEESRDNVDLSNHAEIKIVQ